MGLRQELEKEISDYALDFGMTITRTGNNDIVRWMLQGAAGNVKGVAYDKRARQYATIDSAGEVLEYQSRDQAQRIFKRAVLRTWLTKAVVYENGERTIELI